MECQAFEERLENLLADVLSAEEQLAAQEHLERCARCNRLLEIAEGRLDLLPRDEGELLTSFILGRTTGGSCGQAQSQLCDWVDRRLGTIDVELLSRHVGRCSDCQALVDMLNRSQLVLPAMAELDPGSGFTAEVLRITTAGRKSRGWRSVGFAEWWRRLIWRPRFTWEAAYVGTLVVLLLVGSPGLTLQAASLDKLAAVPLEPRAVWVSVSQQIPTGWMSDSLDAVIAGKTLAFDASERLMQYAVAIGSQGQEAWTSAVRLSQETIKAFTAETRRQEKN